MNIDKHLIFIKGEDRTEEISTCTYKYGRWQVRYGNGKTYSYHYRFVEWLKDPVMLDSSTSVVYQNGQPLFGVNKILDFGDYVRICFETGFCRIYRKNEITVEQNCLNNRNAEDVFEYLKQLAAKVSITKEEGLLCFLSKQYERINFINPSSVLAKYLCPATLNKAQDIKTLIFPFGFNLSQKAATKKALTEQISVIEGPPGTGKTQTILNIIANAVINNKTVAVVSNNNAATANVLEKLEKYEGGFIAAFLGNRENKQRFFDGQTQLYPNMTNWGLDVFDFKELKKELEASNKELEEMLEAKNKVAVLKQQLAALTVEKDYFNEYNANTDIKPYRSLRYHSSDTIIALWLDYQQMLDKNNTVSLKYKIKNLFRYGIVSFSLYKNSPEKVITLFQKLYYERKIKELNEQIETLTKRLESYQFDSAINNYSKKSMELFKAELAKRYSNHNKERRIFTHESLWKDFGTFIKEYPVILSTTHSLKSCAKDNFIFDYVIIDEASQVDIVTGALALFMAKNAVIVGDLKQLPNVVTAETIEDTDRIYRQFTLDDAYHYADNSILSSITKLYKDIPRTLLKEHYRCHPQIIGFCNQKFYNNELIVLTEEKGREKPLVAYKTAKGNHARGRYNQRQIDVILSEILPTIDQNKQSVGIVSPYRMQADKLTEVIGDSGIAVDTVHKYQGREKNVIIITTVVNEVNNFVDDPNLINVAVSRAVDKLIVVVSDGEEKQNSNIGDLLRYIAYNNFEIINSNIYSVFDLLYQNYSEHLLKLMKNRKRVSDYESENLMYAVIEKVLSLPEFQNLACVMHQPLRMLIRNLEKLDKHECEFVMNVLTHTDFIIFNKLAKMPVLVIEVDGYKYHANNPKQLERDKMKDTILQKYGIPVLRIRTNESGEETRLYNKLVQVLK